MMFGAMRKILPLLVTSLIMHCRQIHMYELPSPLTLQLIIEYAKFRSWEQIVLFDDISNGNDNEIVHYAKPLWSCLSDQGMSLSIQSTSASNLPEVLNIRMHRVAAIVLLDRINFTSAENVLKIASNKRLFDYYTSWLLIATQANDATIDLVLRNLTIGINSDVVVATSSLIYNERQETFKSCMYMQPYIDNYLFKWKNYEDVVKENITRNLEYSMMENRTVTFYLVHVYKIRISDNSSLLINPLGYWNPGAPMLKSPTNVAARNNFAQFPIIVGILNGTNVDQKSESSYEEEASEIQPMNDFIDFLSHSLNASLEIVSHEKLGTLTNKVWSNLLGDVYTGNVDIGLGYITINDDRQRDMSFTHPLIRYTRNIYIRPPESGTMRDIFLQPFNNRLLLCVALMQFFIVATIGSINYAVNNVFRKRPRRNETGIGEAALWCTSIICMQGSSWHPSTLSGKTALLASLIFALVTYNAYAGFITSILSVQATGIKTLDDLLHNNFKVGYSDVDDEYMRNANDSALRQLYIKAFNGRESRLSTTQGLQKSIRGRYGFFSSATLARRALRTTLIHERCSLKEIEIRNTFTTVALPMEQDSSYEKIINLSILKMRERGVIDKIREKMLPDMPRCQALTTFHSARIADVYSAFLILIIGIVTSLFLALLERLWSKRKAIQKKIIKKMTK